MSTRATFFPGIVMAALALPMAVAAGPAIDLEQGNVRRIVFLGDSITYDGRYIAYFETWLMKRYPGRAFTVIDAGLPSETVSGLTEEGHANGAFPRPVVFDRLASVLDKTRPDLVFACYGMNCGIYKPLDESRFAKYRDGMTRLHDTVENAGAKIVIVTPPIHDAPHDTHNNPDGLAEYNGVLGRYSDWLVSKRADGWQVVDLHGAMDAEMRHRQKENPDFTFSPDGVHPDDAGHWFMTRQLIAYCDPALSATPSTLEEGLGNYAPLVPPVSERLAVMRNAWLSLTGYKHPMVPAGLPMPDAERRAGWLGERINKLLASTP